jgi:excisionase family DNA binding protein
MTEKREVTETTSPYLRMRQAVAYSQLSETSLRRAERDGHLRFLRPRNRVLIEKTELDRYLRSR